MAAQVVGLTNSRLVGMDRRLNAFFEHEIERPSLSPRALLKLGKASCACWHSSGLTSNRRLRRAGASRKRMLYRICLRKATATPRF